MQPHTTFITTTTEDYREDYEWLNQCLDKQDGSLQILHIKSDGAWVLLPGKMREIVKSWSVLSPTQEGKMLIGATKY